MYNVEQKKQFLNTITNDNSYKSYQRVFRAIEDVEEKFGKDLSEMSLDEVLTVLDLKMGVRVNNIEQSMSLFRVYVDWCIQNGKTTGENNFDKITAADVDKSMTCKTKYIGSPEEFEKMMKVVFNNNYEYNEGIAKPKELSVRLCYEGLEDEEIVSLKKTDVDYTEKTIKSPFYDIVYHVSDRILELCDFCANQETLDYPSRYGIRTERLCRNEYILRQRIGTLRENPEDRPINKTIIVRRVKEINDIYVEETGIYKSLTATKLRESRLLYNICSSGKSFDDYFNTVIRNDVLIRQPNISDRNLYEKGRNLKSVYNLFKEVFF